MDIVDEEGRLFGAVNVIDALVVLLVLAVFLAGFALLFSSEPAPTGQPEYVTLTFGPVSDDTAEAVIDAQNFTTEDGGVTYNVSDTFVTAHPTTDAAVVMKRVRTPETGGPLSVGRDVPLVEGPYTVNGTFSDPGNVSTIASDTTRILLDTQVSPQVASAISVGDTYRIEDRTIATIASKYFLHRSDGSRSLILGLDLQSRMNGRSPSFAQRKLVLGASVPFRSGTYSLSGSIRERTPESTPAVEQRTVQVTTTVSSSTAATIRAGQTFDIDGTRLATIQTVKSYPTGSPSERTLHLELTLQTIRVGDAVEFMGRPVKVGSTVPIETDNASLSTRIIGVGEVAGTETRATLQVEWENVRPDVSDTVRAGLTEQHRGASATVQSVEQEPATVILESEDGQIFARKHPVNRDVSLVISVTGRQTENGFVFHGDTVQSGSNLVLDFGTVTVRGTVTSIRTDQ